MKQAKKLLSVLLAMLMAFSCFGIVVPVFAAGGTPSDAQWNTLLNALAKDGVVNATWLDTNTVEDPNGNVLAAVEAYWAVFNTLANKSPATGNPSGKDNSTGSTESNRVINQVNTSIQNKLATMTGYTADMGTFVGKLICGATVSTGTGSTMTDTNNSTTAPGTNQPAVSDITLTVVPENTVMDYDSIDDMPASIVGEKTFTVSHKNDRFDYTYKETTSGSGCNQKTTYTRTYKYFYYISATTSSGGEPIDTSVLKNSNTIMENNASYFTAELSTLVYDETVESLASVYTTVKGAKDAVVAAFKAEAWNKFFSSYDIDALNSTFTLANEIRSVGEYAIAITDAAALPVVGETKDTLTERLGQIQTGLGYFDAASQAAKDFIVGEGFDRSVIITAIAAIEKEIELIDLRKLKVTIETTVEPFLQYSEDDIFAEAPLTSAELNLAKGTVDGFITAINTYKPENVAEVMGNIPEGLATLSANLGDLITIAGYSEEFALQYQMYVTEVYEATNLADNSKDLLDAVKSYDDWYTNLKALVNEIEAELPEGTAANIIKELDEEMKAHMDSRYQALYERVKAQVQLALDLYAKLEGGSVSVDMTTVNNFSVLKSIFDHFERDVYDFLVASPNFDVPADLLTAYDQLNKEIFADYDAFLKSGGFNKYQQTSVTYMPRPVYDNDVVKTDPYQVTAEGMENLVAAVDGLITNDVIGMLLGGLLGGEEGAAFDIGKMLKDMVGEMIFTDAFINTIVGALYPLLLGEIVKLWETKLGELLGGAGISVTFNKDMYTIAKEAGLYIFPDLMASTLDRNLYADNIEKLNAAGTVFSYTPESTDPVTGETIPEELIIPWDSEVLYNEDGTLDLTWGVDEAEDKEAAFYKGFDDALDALRPLLGALLGGKNWNANKVSGVATAMGFVKAAVTLGAEGCHGYSNLIVPIFEALNIDDFVKTADFEGYFKANDMGDSIDSVGLAFKAIFDGIFSLLDDIGEQPLTTVLSILPNLSYALSLQMVTPLLSMLSTNILISLDVGMMTSCLGSFGLDPNMKEPINVGEMVDLYDMGLDLSGGLNSLLSMLGVSLPEIDQGAIATMGKLSVIDTDRTATTYDKSTLTELPLEDGEAYTIEADKASVAYYLLQYLLGVVTDAEQLSGLLGMLITDEEQLASISATIADLGLTEANPTDLIAALVELFNPVDYSANYAQYNWYEAPVNEDGDVIDYTPADAIYLSYSTNWTRASSEYIIENLDDIILDITTLAGSDSLSEIFTEKVGEALFTNANVTTLAKMLGGLEDTLAGLLAGEDAEGEEVEESEEESAVGDILANLDIVGLIRDELGIDFAAFADYADLPDDHTWGFEDGNGEGFGNAIVSVLAPFAPVLNFLFAGADLTLLDTLTIKGGKGYDAAILPLFEALYIDAPALAEGDDVLAVMMDAFIAKMNALCADPIGEILDTLPGLFYFLASNGLATAVRNLLQPVYVLLDVIRPIYDLDLNAELNNLIAGLTADVGFSIDINNLGVDLVLDILDALLALDFTGFENVVYDLCKVLGAEYESNSTVLTTAKRGTYEENKFDGVDMITVIVGFFYDWLTVEEHAAAFDAAVNSESFTTAKLFKVFENAKPETEQINWLFYFGDDFDLTQYDFSSGVSIQPTMAGLTYPNDWTEETAADITKNLNNIVDAVLSMTGSEYATLGEMLSGMVNIYSTETVQSLVTMLQDLLGGLGDTLVTAAGMLLDIDAEGLMSYEVPADIDTAEEFASALADFLGNAEGLLNWIFFGDDITLFNATVAANGNTDVVATINGGNGYANGLVYILEALGVDAPAATSAADLEAVLLAVFNRLDEILAKPVDEVFEILPNLFYFLNANGISVSAKNLMAPVLTVIDKLAGFGVELDLIAMLNDMINEALAEKADVQIDVMDLNLSAIFALVEDLTGLELDMLSDIFVGFFVGKLESYTSAGGNTAYRVVYDDEFAKYDMVTILVTMALLLATDEDNAAVLDEMIGTDIISALKDIFAGKEIGYVSPDWDYCFGEETDNNTVSVVKNSFAYPNDWTETKAQTVTENLPAYADMIAGLIDENYATLNELIAANVNIFTADNIKAIIDAVAGLLGDIDATLLDAAGILLNVDINGLAAHEVSEDIDTAEEFATELANILSTYATGLVEWLFFGNDYKFFVDESKVVDGIYNGEDLITINGANGYAEGLALLLEALGCENLPAFYDVESFDSAAAVKAILVSACTRIEAVLANPVEEVFNLLPNLLYFLNANGVAIAVDNLIAGVVALLDKLSAFGLTLDLNEVLDIAKLLGIEEEVSISIDNLTVDAVLELAEVMTGLDLTLAKDVLVGFALGEVKEYDSVSQNAGTTYKMFYNDDFAKYDMVTAIVTVGLMLISDAENAAVLDKMLGSEIISGLRKVFAAVDPEYITPDWDYCWAEDGIDYTNNTVQVMKMAIEYPNNWTEESAKYVADNLGPIGDLVASLIDSNYASLAALVADKVTIYSSANIQAIVDAVAGLLKDIDTKLLDIAGLLLDVNITGLVNYTAPEGIDSAEEFAAELANVLNTYAGGLVEWLFFGNDYRFFVDANAADGYEYGEDAIVINGANGYAEGLALILEALGVAAPKAESAADLEAVLLATFTRVDEVLADPVNEAFELLPNLLYFLNANGVSVAINNLIAGVEILLDKLAVFGLEVNIDELLNIEELLGIEKDLSISLDNLTVAALIEVAAELTGLDARLLNDVLVGFALGEVVEYESVCELGYGYKMVYNDEFAKHDMITVLANLVVLIAMDEANATVLKDLIGEDIYQLLLNIFNMSEIPVQDFDWTFTEYADTDHVFSAFETSELFADFTYGELYTEEMAQYIADNFSEFIDNLIYLLGIQIEGVNVNTLQDLINGLINGNLYNSANIIAIRDALAGVAGSISGVEGGDHIKAILKTSLGVDIDAIVNYEVAEFTNDRAQFTTALCELLDPLFPLLKWLLADQDITFFLDEEGYDAITLFGAEGYAYGIIPLLEVLDCDGILTKDSYYAQVANDDSVLLTSILNPLFNRLDAIMLDPATEIFAMLPNLIYFINSNGLDTVVKNTLSAVYVVFNAIEPIAKIDLYEMLGIRLDEINMNTLIELAFDLIAESTGYEFTLVDFSAILELTTGKLESYYSANGKLAYRMVYTDAQTGIEGGTTAEMVTVVLRLLVAFINQSENGEMVLDLMQSEMGMSDDARKYMAVLFGTIQYGMGETERGIDASLATLYYVFYGLDAGVGEAVDILKDINKEWQKILKKLGKSDDPNELTIGNMLYAALDMYFDGIFDGDGLASDGLIKFFQKLIELFKNIINWFKNLFS